MKPSLFVALALAAWPCVAMAEPAAPPVLPAQERFLYARTVGDRKDEVVVISRLVTEQGVSWYDLTSRSHDQDISLKLDSQSLLATYTEVTSRSKNVTLKRATTVLENKAEAPPDEIVVTGAESLPYSLRAFPWATRQKAKVAFLGFSGGGGFSFDLSVTGKETISVGGAGVECWKAQLSLSGLMGTFFGKSYLWYSTAYPHYLVKSESASAGPGSPTAVLSLESYSSGPGAK